MRPKSFKHWVKRSVCIAFVSHWRGLTPQLFADLEALEAEVQAAYEQRLGASMRLGMPRWVQNM